MRVNLTDKQREELALDVLAFLMDRQGSTTATKEQIAYFMRLAEDTGIEHSLAAHLCLHQDLKRLFEKLRECVESQKETRTVIDLKRVALTWAADLLDDANVPNPHRAEVLAAVDKKLLN